MGKSISVIAFVVLSTSVLQGGSGPSKLEQEKRGKLAAQSIDAQLAAVGGGVKKDQGRENSVQPEARDESMLRGSVILANNGFWTFVPERALLCVPTNQRHRVVEKPSGGFLRWTEFYRKNRGWLRTEAVTLERIKGRKPFSDLELRRLKSSKVMTVATYKDRPVTVLQTSNHDDTDEK